MSARPSPELPTAAELARPTRTASHDDGAGMPGSAAGLLSALHLASPSLPIGGYAYSQGLEWAIEEGTVHDAQSAHAWIRDLLCLGLARQDLVLWRGCYEAAFGRHLATLQALNQRIYALKETAELRLETTQMGQSLTQLFPIWDPTGALTAIDLDAPWTYPAAHAALCACANLSEDIGLTAYVWSWLENQVLVAVRHVPLGQTEGQQMLKAMHADAAGAMQTAKTLSIDTFGSATVGMAIASAQHETQYSRLFRS